MKNCYLPLGMRVRRTMTVFDRNNMSRIAICLFLLVILYILLFCMAPDLGDPDLTLMINIFIGIDYFFLVSFLIFGIYVASKNMEMLKEIIPYTDEGTLGLDEAHHFAALVRSDASNKYTVRFLERLQRVYSKHYHKCVRRLRAHRVKGQEAQDKVSALSRRSYKNREAVRTIIGLI